MPTDHCVRPNYRQCVKCCGYQSRQQNEQQTIDVAQCGSVRRFAPQYIDLVAKNQDLRLTPRAALQQPNERPTKQSEQLNHRPRASPDSRRFARYRVSDKDTGLIQEVDIVIGSAKLQADHPELFHYTRPEGFRAIIGSQTLWATLFRDLKDHQEISVLKPALRVAIIELFDKAVAKRSRRRRCLHYVIHDARRGRAVRARERTAEPMDGVRTRRLLHRAGHR